MSDIIPPTGGPQGLLDAFDDDHWWTRRDIGGLLRAARRRAVLSQRELAERTGLPKSAIARMECDVTGATTRIDRFSAALTACGVRLVVMAEGDVPLTPWSGPRDRAGRLLPVHLDIWPVAGEHWWGCFSVGPHLRPQPEYTFSTFRGRRRRRQGREADEISLLPPWLQPWQGD